MWIYSGICLNYPKKSKSHFVKYNIFNYKFIISEILQNKSNELAEYSVTTADRPTVWNLSGVTT